MCGGPSATTVLKILPGFAGEGPTPTPDDDGESTVSLSLSCLLVSVVGLVGAM